MYIRKRGNTWYYTIETTDEFGKRKRLVRAGGKTKPECEKAYRAAMIEKDRTGRIRERDNITLSIFLDQWMKEDVERNCRENTVRAYESCLKNHIKKDIGNNKVISITSHQLQAYINKKSDTLSRSTVSQILSVLKKALNYAVAICDIMPSNPALPVRLPKLQTIPEKTHVFSQDELAIIFRHFPKDHQFYIPIQLGYHTGMRLGECLALSWDDVDMDARMIRVHSTLVDGSVQPIPKTGASVREIPFGQKLYAILKFAHKKRAQNRLRFGEYYKQNNMICVFDDGTQIDADAMRYFGQFCRKTFGAGSFHSLRHTHATMLLEAGEDLEIVSKRLGHSNINTTAKVYSHILDKRTKKSVALLDQVL